MPKRGSTIKKKMRRTVIDKFEKIRLKFSKLYRSPLTDLMFSSTAIERQAVGRVYQAGLLCQSAVHGILV